LDFDPVDVLMTRMADLHRVDADDTVEAAAAALARNGVRQLVVTSGELVTGLVDAARLRGRPKSERLRGLVDGVLPVMPSNLSLGAAARALVASGRRCTLVVEGDRVVGLVTRGDLARAGVPWV